jgi:hypothetical protein
MEKNFHDLREPQYKRSETYAEGELDRNTDAIAELENTTY